MLTVHGRAVEADLLRFYGVHVGDLGTPTLSWRKLGVLVAGFPKDSALSRSVADDAEYQGEPTQDELARMWRLEHHLLASIFDSVSALIWQNGGGKGKPVVYPRPKAKPKVDVRYTSAELRERNIALLQRIGPRKD